ncbi:MAG TPA: sugar phosphate isomerase/epimerase [Verrucomicrobiales bacterium]|nr:sugar phosphate isomerase/epimerase [Verrucomicrobiales bacterium]HIL71872.1 sugar phosphate isomerase/epimerase [Verrucomicrobiota bacterium]
MPKLGVITDGISRDFERALQVMTEADLEYAELQFLWDKEVGDLSDDEMAKAKALVDQYGVKVSCISRHNFGGLLIGQVEVGDEIYNQHMDGLKRCIAMAKEFGTQTVRIMSFRREMILFGKNGAEHWIISKGSWEKLQQLLTPVVNLAEAEQVTLVLETGNNAMIPSAYLGAKLVREMGSDHLKILWDPCNSIYANELTYPDGYDCLNNGSLGHFHIKDAKVDMPKALVEFCELGKGDMAPILQPLADRLKQDGYDGVTSLESVYRPTGGNFEDGFKASVKYFKQLFS